jgi:hypothetical protein
MYQKRLCFTLTAGLTGLLLAGVAAAAPSTFVEAAATSTPAPPPASIPAVPPDPQVITATIFTNRAAFQAVVPGLPLEDFEEGNAVAGNLNVCDAPLTSAGDAACGFNPGDILAGVAFQDNPGPELGALILLGAGTSLNPTQAVVANTFADAFDVVFNPPVFAAGMDLHSTAAPGVGDPDTLVIQIFDAGGVLIGTDPAAAASGPGNFWGVTSTTPIGRISMLSTNNRAEGVDNIEFGAAAVVPTLDRFGLLALCAALGTMALAWMRRRSLR